MARLLKAMGNVSDEEQGISSLKNTLWMTNTAVSDAWHFNVK